MASFYLLLAAEVSIPISVPIGSPDEMVLLLGLLLISITYLALLGFIRHKLPNITAKLGP